MEAWVAMLLHTPRVLAALLLLPLFARESVPLEVRAALALCLGAFAALGPPAGALPAMPAARVLALVLKEGLVGFAIGLSFSMVLQVGMFIGQVVDQQTGLTFSSNIDPQFGNQVSVTGQLLDRVFLSFVVASGGLLVIVETLLLSFENWPVASMLPDLARSAPPLLLSLTSRLFALALLLSAPVLLVLFMLDVGLGFLARAAPQLNLFNLSHALKSWIALLVLLASLGFVLEQGWRALLSVRSTLLQIKGG